MDKNYIEIKRVGIGHDPSDPTVSFQVTDQLVCPWQDSAAHVSRSGISIYMRSHPDFEGSCFYARGTSEYGNDEIVHASPADFDRIVSAIEEFNAARGYPNRDAFGVREAETVTHKLKDGVITYCDLHAGMEPCDREGVHHCIRPKWDAVTCPACLEHKPPSSMDPSTSKPARQPVEDCPDVKEMAAEIEKVVAHQNSLRSEAKVVAKRLKILKAGLSAMRKADKANNRAVK